MVENKIVLRQIDKIFIFLFFISCINSFLGLLFYVALMIYWSYGAEGGLKALIFLTLRGILSSAVAATPTFSVIRWVVIIGSAIIIISSTRLSGRQNRIYHAIILCLLCFDMIVIFSCLYICSYPVTSMFKMISFSISFLSVIVAIANTNEYIDWKSFITLLLLPLFVISFILIPFDNFKIVNDDLQGVFNHVNMLGMMSSIFIAVILHADIFKTRPKLRLIIIACVMVMIYLSGSRTGMITAIITIIAFMFAQPGNTSNKIVVFLLIICGVFLLLMFSTNFSNLVHEFIFKNNTDSLWASREEVIAVYKDHYNSSKIVGTGFMVPYLAGNTNYNLRFDLLVEPGNMLWAVLGDVGILGLSAFIIILLVVLYNGAFAKLYLFIVPVLMCMGEMVFFSVNNMSILLYVLIALYLFDESTNSRNFYEKYRGKL